MDLLSLLRVGISNINIGMLQFSEVQKTKILMDLDKYSLEQQMRVVDTMVYQRGKRTMTGNALTMVANQVGILSCEVREPLRLNIVLSLLYMYQHILNFSPKILPGFQRRPRKR